MQERRMVTWDGNEAAANIAYRISEVISIYPITPASPMGEHADQWSSDGVKNLWGDVPTVAEMQSEGGAAGAVHGALQLGALTTTFTASQGLLLMIPNLYKIAGELTAGVIHIAARTLATHALSIFGDHSDVYAARQTGFAMLASGSVQEAHDLAAIAHGATLRARLPFLHFFDGFRTSHEIAKTDLIDDATLSAMIDMELVSAHRQRGLSPDAPDIRGTAQNPDVFFQAREAINPFYEAGPQIVQDYMDRFAELTGRQYHLFDYEGAADAERVVIIMGSGAEAVHNTVSHLAADGEKVGVLKVRLFRPFSAEHLLAALPKTVKKIAVLDRTKEPGATGEPLYHDVVTAVHEAYMAGDTVFDGPVVVVGGRYGLSSKEFTPAMIKGVYDHLKADRPKNHFTVGIVDDVSHTSIAYDPSFQIEDHDVTTAVFFGLGADGTVGANKNSIKIIGGETDNYAQGYFVYDSKKSGAITISHLRFGPRPIQSPYLITQSKFVACHQEVFLDRYDVLSYCAPGAVFLLNSRFSKDEVWASLPAQVQQQLIEKKIRFFVIDAYQVAREARMGMRINTIMQTCFFAISGVLPREEAIAQIKKAIKKTYSAKGDEIVERNYIAVDLTLANLFEVSPQADTSGHELPAVVSSDAPDFVQQVTAQILKGNGDMLPVSAFVADGTWPSGTTRYEKRGIAQEIPIWESDLCIQCGKCAFVCPHAAIRAQVATPEALEERPVSFRSVDAKGKEFKGQQYIIQVAPEDCTGCGICVSACPAKDKQDPDRKAINMRSMPENLVAERENFSFFLQLPQRRLGDLKPNVKNTQLLEPLMEFSGACAGCGETPYIKLITQLYGDRMVIANATGCSSIYGGNLPTTPYTKNADGRGPAWANSLFEDNAEFGYGFSLAVDQKEAIAKRLLTVVGLDDTLVQAILTQDQSNDEGIEAQRANVETLKAALATMDSEDATQLTDLADSLVKKSVWIIGGDGWAYDIGYGGLDHVFASGRNVNILVMDTEVYSNTGGQASKATPLGAVAKFAAGGKPAGKKDLGAMAMAYGNVYVAQIAMGAKDAQTVKAITEAESYPGVSLIIAYSHCIAHGYGMEDGLDQQEKAVASGYWPLYRYDPRVADEGKNPFQLDSKDPSISFADYAYNEARYASLLKASPEHAAELMGLAQKGIDAHWAKYKSKAEK
ncbi:MAG: pyruvate:ferredoxin (flavodoxin) oxidoreductase [Deltaproteobacteria bacterium]|nr:pyruvate:ferredoxin (flavodoxin) oxidoreductase [Deltaproteobacteria bacterium]